MTDATRPLSKAAKRWRRRKAAIARARAFQKAAQERGGENRHTESREETTALTDEHSAAQACIGRQYRSE